MKKKSALLSGVLGVTLILLSQLATAGSPPFADSETAVCTVVKRVSIDLAKPLTGSNPIEGLATLPAVCNGRAMTKLEFNDGMRSLMGLGWQITSLSHQITPLGVNAANGSSELLVSAVFGIERTGSNRSNSGR
jgi:hypothetical protein